MKRVILILLLSGVLLGSTAHASSTTLREQEWKTEPCIAWIVDHENRSWSPTVGSIYGSYGLPQANPGTKMAKAGRDWRTNPLTQLRWMRLYVKKYGGACQAEAHWKRMARYYAGDWHGGSY